MLRWWAFSPEVQGDGQEGKCLKTTQKPVIFEVRLNTHSVNLSYALVQVCSLQDGQGKVYKATAWKGSSPAGHHRSGVLEFPELKGNPQNIKLIIRGVADVPTRIFGWKLEG
ncbi:MAG: hypothetical protein ABH969_00510 [Pseudomonadota bacterium]